MSRRSTKKLPFDVSLYMRPGTALRDAWPRLHQGDCEKFPDTEMVTGLLRAHPALEPAGSVARAVDALQNAWRAYHAGAFAEAMQEGAALGHLGGNVANKAGAIRATYLESEPNRTLTLYQEVVTRAEALQTVAPDLPNAWYFHALALGRYSQGISIAEALAQGLAGKVRRSLDRALHLAPHHAEAHIALGSYHAEIVAKVGALVAGLTYGAKKDAALTHFETALKLLPFSAIARIQYADALAMLFGKSRLAAARQLYAEAAACTAEDAMERLDVEAAKSEVSG